MNKYIRTPIGIYEFPKGFTTFVWKSKTYLENENHEVLSACGNIIAQADTITELCDEIVLIENGNEHNIVYLQEAYDRIDEYREQGNYEPRLIGRIKVGLDKKAVAEWKENEQGLYDWVLL